MSQLIQPELFNCEQCSRQARLDQQYYIEDNNEILYVCYFCYDDSIVKIWNYREGDYNDIFQNSTIKGTGKQIREYCLSAFSGFEDRKDEIDDIGTDGIGFEIYYPSEIDEETGEEYEDQELRIELFNEAREIEDYNSFDAEIEIDLTEENV